MIGDTIASGYVDAIAYGWDSTTTTKGAGGKFLSDQLNVVIDARLAAPALMIVMNRATWDSMPADLKKIVEKHAAELSMGSARVREAQEVITKKKVLSDPRFTALTFNDEQRAELQRVTAPSVAEWKANMIWSRRFLTAAIRLLFCVFAICRMTASRSASAIMVTLAALKPSAARGGPLMPKVDEDGPHCVARTS